jgi:hypothetical protein
LTTLIYFDGVFCELRAGLESKLTKALLNSIRFIYNLGRFSEVSRYRLELHIFKPFVKIRLNLSLLLYKIFNNKVPAYLCNVSLKVGMALVIGV